MDVDSKPKYNVNSGYVPPKMQQNLQQASNYLKSLQTQLDSSVWQPGKKRSREFGNAYPITATFVALFATLSFFPVATYLTIVSFVLLTTLALAVGIAIGATLFVGFWGGVFLFFILLIALTIAIIGTLTVLGAHILYRLFFHLRSEQGEGLRGWSNETKDRLVPPSMQAYANDAKARASEYYNGTKREDGSVKVELQ